jgi:hypothetical protein
MHKKTGKICRLLCFESMSYRRFGKLLAKIATIATAIQPAKYTTTSTISQIIRPKDLFKLAPQGKHEPSSQHN